MNTNTLTTPIAWPRKHTLFNGVKVSATCYDEVVHICLTAAEGHVPALVDLMPVSVLIPAVRDPWLREKLNAFDVVAPDGQPVRWSLNFFHRARLSDRVYGPELTRRLCQAAAERGVPIYLYGSTPEVIEKLSANLKAMFPALEIAGAESPPFRPLTPDEDRQAVDRINASGAGLVFIGTGGPRQEIFAHAHRHSIKAVQVCVGAAFDFHAGTKKMAPSWMQKRGLEWLFRLVQEPGRLWKRYLVQNTLFCALFVRYAVQELIFRPRWILAR
jgi:N-acetylglucosaminyldiphosphoundecaprenol N-acetyl-beta-D-mannosaminyltransferase